MKKNIFMIMMMSLVFLGLGNISLGYSAGCADEYKAMTNANNQVQTCLNLCEEGNPTPEICSTTCQSDMNIAQSATESYDTCKANNPGDSNPTKCSDVDASRIEQGPNNSCPSGYTADGQGILQCCNPQTEGTKGSYCKETPTSSLNNDPHALVSIPGISCECEKGYGEYYDTTEGKTKCGLCSLKEVCCGTKLNTKIPFIGNCIESSTQASGSTINETTAFPILVSSLVKILISVILIASFVLIIAAGVMWATGNAKGGKDMIIKVAIGLAILGASGVILRLINPNFFG